MTSKTTILAAHHVLRFSIFGAVALALLFLLLMAGHALAWAPASNGTLVFLIQQSLGSREAAAKGLTVAMVGGAALGVITLLAWQLVRLLLRQVSPDTHR